MGHHKTYRRFATLCLFAGISCTDVGPSKHNLPTSGNNGNVSNGGGSNCLDLDLTTRLSWQTGIGTLFKNNCASCHATTYGTFGGVKNNINGVLASIDAGSMPKAGPLSQDNKALIHNWVNAGMLETDSADPTAAPTNCSNGATNGSSPTPSSPSEQSPTPTPAATATTSASALLPTYSKGVQQIMATSCTSCHSTSGGQDPYLDSLTLVTQNYDKVMQKINSGEMPTPVSATSKLPQDKITMLQQWGSSPNAPYGKFAP